MVLKKLRNLLIFLETGKKIFQINILTFKRHKKYIEWRDFLWKIEYHG